MLLNSSRSLAKVGSLCSLSSNFLFPRCNQLETRAAEIRFSRSMSYLDVEYLNGVVWKSLDSTMSKRWIKIFFLLMVQLKLMSCLCTHRSHIEPGMETSAGQWAVNVMLGQWKILSGLVKFPITYKYNCQCTMIFYSNASRHLLPSKLLKVLLHNSGALANVSKSHNQPEFLPLLFCFW